MPVDYSIDAEHVVQGFPCLAAAFALATIEIYGCRLFESINRGA